MRIRWRLAARDRTALVPSLLAILLSCSGDDPPRTLETVYRVAPWVKTDLRVPDLQQARLAAAKYAARCSRIHPTPLATYVSGVVLVAAGTPLLPDHVASQLACAYDAPADTSCEALDECAEAGKGTAGVFPECLGAALRGTDPKTGKGVFVACRAFGGSCYGFEGGALCAMGLCPAGELSVCDGDSISVCTMGVRMKSPCGRGATCLENAEGIVDCVGKGPACSDTPRCDGARAINCLTNNFGSAREQVIDCSSFGMTCALKDKFDGSQQATCEPNVIECDPRNDAATCTGAALRICAAGSWWNVSCAELGLSGRCSAGAGAKGDAGCR